MKKAIISTLILAACGTAPVTGQFDNGTRIAGKATAVSGGQSTLQLTTETGQTCTGHFTSPIIWDHHTTLAESGTLTCANGQTGTFTYAGTAKRGEGFGQIDGQRFSFVYGDAPISKAR